MRQETKAFWFQTSDEEGNITGNERKHMTISSAMLYAARLVRQEHYSCLVLPGRLKPDELDDVSDVIASFCREELRGHNALS